jgi:hypothetical protein
VLESQATLKMVAAALQSKRMALTVQAQRKSFANASASGDDLMPVEL